MPSGNLDHLDQVAERQSVSVDLILAHETELARVDEQGGHAQCLRRWRWRGELAVHRHHCALAVAEAVAAVAVLDQVLSHLLLQMLALRRHPGLEPFRDCLFRRVEGPVGPLALCEVEADVG